jgi:GH25 family lysozyme M1 (1,4-beta-N-acetylmuramidase)
MSATSQKVSRRIFFEKFHRAACSLFFLALGAVDIFAQRPLGTDVSNFQPGVNWTTVRNAGVTFAWTKATEGTYYTSPSFVSQENGAKGAGIYVGAYHYARPGADTNLTGAFSADSEAAFFWSVASNYVKGGSTYLVPMLDWEDTSATNGHNGFNGFTTAFMSAWVNEWCNTVSNFAKASGVTIRPIVYTGTWYSNPSGGYAGLNSTVAGWPAWISAYNGQNVQTGGPASSYPWSTWTVWQYADTNWSGGDSDVFNGSDSTLGTLVIGGVSAPFITAQPLLRAVDTGGSIAISASAGGTAPLSYQWTLAGENVPGATNTIYTLTNAQAENAGNYALVVTNLSGSVTSNPSWLLVYPVQATVFADNFDANTAANWIVNTSSSDNAVTFNFDYSALGIPSAPNSTGGSTRGLQMKANLTNGAVAALSLSPVNQNFSGDYRLHFDAWINVNGPFPAGGAGSTEFLTAGIGTAGNRVEWTGNAAADGYYFSADGDGDVSASSTTSGDYCAYANATLFGTSSGIYIAGTDTTVRDNANIYYSTAFPNGHAAPPLQQANYPQQSGSLSSGTFGLAWHDVIVSKRGSTVDWVVDGVRLAMIFNASLTASNVFVGFWDPFSSLSANNAVNFGLVDNVRVELPAVAPSLLTQAGSQTVKLGTNITFTASASGLPSPNYQWRFNGTNILGATNSTFALAFVAATNVGNYSVVVTNLAGSMTSTNALLALAPPAAAQFQSIALSGGAVQISFTGDAYWNYTIEVSTNLTSWSVCTNLTSANGLFNFTAGSVTNAPQEFFRARAGP